MTRTLPLVAALALSACGSTPADAGGRGGGDHAGSGGEEPPPPPGSPLQVAIELVLDEAGDAERVDQEEARRVAEDVARRREAQHGDLPPVEQQAGLAEPDAWPIVTIKNDTRHGLVVWFAGPCPRTVALLPSGEHTVELCEGRYDIAAQLSADDFLPFVGEGDDLDNGYGYSLSFYVLAEPRTVVRRRNGD